MKNALPFILAQAQIHPLIYGKPGSGKSAVAAAAAKKLGVPYLRVDLSCRSEIEVQGAAMPSDLPSRVWCGGQEHSLDRLQEQHDKCLLWVRPEWAYLAHSQRCLIVLEELLSCNQQVHAAALQTLSERTVGGLPLHPDTMIVSISNYHWCGVNMHEVGASLANRMCHLNWDDEDDSAWGQGLLNGGDFPDPDIPVLNGWRDHLSEIGSMMRAASRKLPSLSMGEEQAKKANLSRGWPSHRSLWNTVKAIAACRSVGVSKDEEMRAVAGLIGEGPAVEMYTFWTDQDLPDPDELLAWCAADFKGSGAGQFPVGTGTYSKGFRIPDRNDKLYTVAIQLWSAFLRNKTLENLHGYYHYCELAAEHHPDVVLQAVSECSTLKESLGMKGFKTSTFPKYHAALARVSGLSPVGKA